ncbi:MAG TPA: hypothetical protein VMW50_12735 [Dehalococcoidia bacterium]|nr:hypothetical protein [Dehalococcoidia bacterium]
MKAVITSVVVAIIPVLIFSLPALAQESGTITITMTGVNEISISLDKTQWPLGEVAAGTEYMTSPPIEWCTLTVEGNCNVNTFIVGEDAEWVGNPSAYKWTLSNDGTNGENVYGLWFRISGDTARGYVPITKTEGEFWPYAGGSSLAPGDTKQFGLKLLTPTYFVGNRQMQTQITISAVAA